MKNGVWVEVLRTGTWIDSSGKEVVITDQDLADIERDTNALLAEDFRPPLRFGGHKEGLNPAYGWVGAVKKHGDRLSALFTDVPKAAAQAINQRLFKSVSSGLRFGFEVAGKTYAKVLHHVAVLGATLPAVTGLKEIPALFDDDGNGQPVVVNLENDEAATDPNQEKLEMKELEELKQKVADLQARVDAHPQEIADLKAAHQVALAETKKAAETETAALKADVAKFEAEKAKAEVTAVVDQAVRDGRIAPSAKDDQIKIGLTMHGAEFAEGETAPFETWKKALTTGPKAVKFEEKAETGANDADGSGDQGSKEFQEGLKEGREFSKANQK